MKKYVVTPIIRGELKKKLVKTFGTRPLANKYMGELVYKYDLQVEDEIKRDNHLVEFVCDDYTRFFVGRV